MSYHKHEEHCRNKDVKIVPFIFFKQEVRVEVNKSMGQIMSSRKKRFVQPNKNHHVSVKKKAIKPLHENVSTSKDICKLCSCPLIGRKTGGQATRFQIAHHMFSQHYKRKILNMLDVKQTKCDICGKNFENRTALARHLGETHEMATKLYKNDLNETYKIHISN